MLIWFVNKKSILSISGFVKHLCRESYEYFEGILKQVFLAKITILQTPLLKHAQILPN